MGSILATFFLFIPLLYPPVGIVLLIVWLIFLALSVRELYKKKFKFPTKLFSYLIPLSCGLVGMAVLASFFQNSTYDWAFPIPEYANGALVLLNLFLISYAIFKEKDWRMTLTAAGIVLALISVNFYFLSGMSITGSWL